MATSSVSIAVLQTRCHRHHMHHNHRYYRPSLNLIQLGLTLTDTAGNLSDLGIDKTCICQFNFSDFDAAHEASVPNSIELLRRFALDPVRYWGRAVTVVIVLWV
ncbi:hypothetical protein RJ640_003263 [Escallonia rubra]|uniref:Uncharacterized protein n=1 Tax=Escallonia rubra TaxID=112253 RepID=A0AA88RDG8_9ASTE|nr:hypothetical protein RJ640_003263 [Escallonia rubra]